MLFNLTENVYQSDFCREIHKQVGVDIFNICRRLGNHCFDGWWTAHYYFFD